MKTCKNCEWAGNCAWDDNAVMCKYYMEEHGEYIPADKVVEEAEKCLEYCEVKKVKCKHCNGTGYNDTQKGTVMTEQEYIQTCNTEQLAELLCDIWHGIDDVINIMAEDEKISKKDAMKMWLKRPHKNKEYKE